MDLNQNRPCMECGHLVMGRMLRCLTCNTKALGIASDDLKARARERKRAKRAQGHWGNGICIDCSAPTVGKMKRCLACKTLSLRAYAKGWATLNRDHRQVYRANWYRNNREKCIATGKRWRASPQGVLFFASYKPRAAPKRRAAIAAPLLAYPFVFKARDDHAELLLVNSLVPRGMPGREDVVQSVMLALLERQTTVEQLKAGGIAPFLRQFRRDNYESGGYAVSLDVPRFGGGSWHDVLPDRSF